MAFVKHAIWVSGNDVLPADLNRYEDALDDHETNKLNKTDIVNNLTSTDVTKVLSAPQGKELAKQITDLSSLKAIDTRGVATKPSDYVSKFKITGLKNGADVGLSGKETYAHVIGYNAWLDVTAGVSEILLGSTGKIYSRTKIDAATWTTPKELATTDKVDISFPYATGFVSLGTTGGYNSKISKINNYVEISIVFKKTDDTSFSNQVTIGTLPVGYRPSDFKTFGGGSLIVNGIEINTNGNIVINCSLSTAYGICIGFYI